MSSRLLRDMPIGEAVSWEPPMKHGAQPARGRESAASGPRSPAPEEAGDLERQAEARAQVAYRRGLQEGEAGARQQAAEEVRSALEQMACTAAELAGYKPRLRHEAEEDVVKLAMAVSRRILHREIATDPEALLGLIRAALDKLDGREICRMRANPQDAPVLEKRFQDMFEKLDLPRRIEIFADASLQRGAAIFETARGGLDASVDTQLKEIERGFTDLMRRPS
jgi:flagellar assembly protein FliH